MKIRWIAFILFVSIFYTCKKDNGVLSEDNGFDIGLLPEDDGCIAQLVVPVTSHGTLSDAEYSLIDSLFILNRIDKTNRLITASTRDSVDVYDGRFEFWEVKFIQYTNGLPIFTVSGQYIFKNGIFFYLAGDLSRGTFLDTSPTLTLGQIRKLFIDDIEQYDQKGSLYKDSCLNAELGYYNINVSSGNNVEKLVKAWRVTPKYNSYPQAFYQDHDGQRIVYSNGFIY